jgi:UDP-GlcNAc:undecaprenyl-phosphate GlcNAc-1-phosphate transferase
MFALPTVIAAFVPIWIAIISGLIIFLISLLVLKTNHKKVEV